MYYVTYSNYYAEAFLPCTLEEVFCVIGTVIYRTLY